MHIKWNFLYIKNIVLVGICFVSLDIYIYIVYYILSTYNIYYKIWNIYDLFNRIISHLTSKATVAFFENASVKLLLRNL